MQKEISPEALALHERSLVIDGVIVAPSAEWALDNMHAGGVNAGNWSIATHSENHLAAMLQMEAMRWLLARAPESYAGLISGRHRRRIVRALRRRDGFQTHLEQEFHLLSILWRLGLRILQFTYNTRTLWLTAA